jgi:hypothetical protein
MATTVHLRIAGRAVNRQLHGRVLVSDCITLILYRSERVG